MKKIIFSTIIIFLIFFTSIIKNSTKKIDNKIFNLKEDIRLLNEKYELVLLDYNFLSSPKKLNEYQKKYFQDDLIPLDIQSLFEIVVDDKEIYTKKIGILNCSEILYNPSYEEIFKEETKSSLKGYEKVQLTEFGAVNVTTGVYTGRSPKDKYIVKDKITEKNIQRNL